MSPLDLERTFGLIGGDISHGTLSLDQLFLGAPDARLTAITADRCRGFTCAAPARIPGGGVSGAPGHNAARENPQRDFRRGRLAAGWR